MYFHRSRVHIKNLFVFIVIIDCVSSQWTNYKHCGEGYSSSKDELFLPLRNSSHELNRKSWPWLAAIVEKNSTSYNHMCGGTLISSTKIVTAAHCFYKSRKIIPYHKIHVFLGRFNLSLDPESEGALNVEISGIFVHPDYVNGDLSFTADIAVILLSDKITFTENIQPACLETGSSSKCIGRIGSLVGWGRSNLRKRPSVPSRIQSKIVSNDTCRNSDNIFKWTGLRTHICAGDLNGSGPCYGDSGGGIFIYDNNHWMLCGITSYVIALSGFCDTTKYAAFTDVDLYIEWIHNVRMPRLTHRFIALLHNVLL